MGDKVFSDRLKPGKIFFKVVAGFLAFLIFFDILGNNHLNCPQASAQNFSTAAISTVTSLKGLRIDPGSPFQFNFLFDSKARENPSSCDTSRITDYFFAALTIPNDDIWVNLSPEKSEVCDDFIGTTRLGRDLLEQDYLLKQAMASLLRPDCEPGRTYWRTLYARLTRRIGTSNIPVDTLNRVCVVPDSATVAQGADGISIKTAHLKVMLESDYQHNGSSTTNITEEESQNALRELVLPCLEREVNFGKKFATLRQIHDALIVALWFKKHFKSTLYQIFVDKKITGRLNSVKAEELGKIYSIYIKTQREGMYDFVRNEVDAVKNKIMRRRYIAGGFFLPSPNYLRIVPAADTNKESPERDWDVVTVDAKKVFSKPPAPAEGEAKKSQLLTAGDLDDDDGEMREIDRASFLKIFFNPYFSDQGQSGYLRCVSRRVSASCLQIKIEGIKIDDFTKFKREAIMADIKDGKIKFSALGHDKQQRIASEEVKDVRIEISDGSLVFLLPLKSIDDVSLMHLRGRDGKAETFKIINCYPCEGYDPFEEWNSILKSELLSDGQLHRIDIILRNLLLQYKAVGINLTGDGRGYERMFMTYVNIQDHLGRTMAKVMARKERSSGYERERLDAYFYRLYCAAQGSRYARRMAEYYTSIESYRRFFLKKSGRVDKMLRWISGVTTLYKIAKKILPQDAPMAAEWFNQFDSKLYTESKKQLQDGALAAINRLENPKESLVQSSERMGRIQKVLEAGSKLFLDMVDLYFWLPAAVPTILEYFKIITPTTAKPLNWIAVFAIGLKLYRILFAPGGYISRYNNYAGLRITADMAFYGAGESLGKMQEINSKSAGKADADIQTTKTLDQYIDRVKGNGSKYLSGFKGRALNLFRRFTIVFPFLAPYVYNDFAHFLKWKKLDEKQTEELSPAGSEADLYIHWDRLLNARNEERHNASVDSVAILINGISEADKKILARQTQLLLAPRTRITFVSSRSHLEHDVRPLLKALAAKPLGQRQVIIDLDTKNIAIDGITQMRHFPGNSHGVDLSLFQLQLLNGVVAAEGWKAKNSGGSAVIDGAMVGPVSVSDAIVDHVVWVDRENAKRGEVVIKRDDFDIDYFNLGDESVDLDKQTKGSVVQVDRNNPQRLQYMRRGGIMTIGDGMHKFLQNLGKSVFELDKEYIKTAGEGARLPSLERSWFFRIPLTRLFAGSHMDSYIGWRTRGIPSEKRVYYFSYGEAIENAFKDVTAAGLNFKVHIPFVQGAATINMTENNVDRQVKEFSTKLQGAVSIQGSDLIDYGIEREQGRDLRFTEKPTLYIVGRYSGRKQ
jgi:hypothetical protein